MQQPTYTQPHYNSTEFTNSLSHKVYASRADQHEYTLVIQPDSLIAQQLETEKKAFDERYKTGTHKKDDLSVTVMQFFATEDMEPTIIRWMQRICSQVESFIITVNNYSGYPPNKIHLRVQYTQAIQQLGQALKVVDNYVKSYGLPAAKISNQPHITLAQSIPENVYTKAMFDYASRDFHASFIVNELVLLKQKHQFDAAKKINILGLMPALATAACNEPLLNF